MHLRIPWLSDGERVRGTEVTAAAVDTVRRLEIALERILDELGRGFALDWLRSAAPWCCSESEDEALWIASGYYVYAPICAHSGSRRR